MYIDYKKQPTHNTCGQTCLAMIFWTTVEEIIKICGCSGGTYTKDLVSVFDFYRIKTSRKLICMNKHKTLPDFCIVKLKREGLNDTHWSVFHEGVFYDPAIGIIDRYPSDVRVLSYLEIYEEPKIDYNLYLSQKEGEK